MRILLPIVLFSSLVSSFAQDTTSQILKQDSLVQSVKIEEVIGTQEVDGNNDSQTEMHSDSVNLLLQNAIDKGRGLTGTGLTLHFIGLGVSTIMSFTSSGSEGGTVVSAVSYILQTIGPILACSGASSVDGNFRKLGVSIPESHVWREYAKGWGYVGVGVGSLVAGIVMVNEQDQPMPGLLLLFGGAAFEIIGEVKWIKAMVHSAVYVSNAAKSIQKKPEISLLPYYDLKGKYGMVAQIGF
jgi:hypothetical protein